MYERDQLFIDGKWTVPESDSVITVVSPHSEAVIGHAAGAGPTDVDRAVQAARAAFDTGPWPRMQPGERIEAITRLAGIYKEHRADMAERQLAGDGVAAPAERRDDEADIGCGLQGALSVHVVSGGLL